MTKDLKGIDFARVKGTDVVGPIRVNKTGEPNVCMQNTEELVKSTGHFLGLNPVEFEKGEKIYSLKGTELHPGLYKMEYKSKPYIVEVYYKEGYSGARIVKGGTPSSRKEFRASIREDLKLNGDPGGK